MTKKYYLTDDSGTPISIFDLHIFPSNDDNAFNTYPSELDLLDALNARTSVLNDVNEFAPKVSTYILSLLKTVFLSVLVVLACFGVEDIFRIYSVIHVTEPIRHVDYQSNVEYDDTGVGEAE